MFGEAHYACTYLWAIIRVAQDNQPGNMKAPKLRLQGAPRDHCPATPSPDFSITRLPHHCMYVSIIMKIKHFLKEHRELKPIHEM